MSHPFKTYANMILTNPTITTVKLNANRVVIGSLRGFDQFMNLVVDNTVEVNGNEKNDIGIVVGSFCD